MAEAKKVKNPIDCLFDEKNNEPIVLFNEKGEEIKFEQIAIIPKGAKIYAILKPMINVEGLADDEALVFEIREPDENNEELLMLVTDVEIIDEVFEVYDKLMDEAEAAGKKGKK